ncbi:MAG TPA: GIY-YIG nuclease family protein [Metalysinibacillus sp.]
MTGVIYKIENKVNGKVYVGQTVVGVNVRVGQHFSSLRCNKHNNDYLQRAWNKYGEENFIPTIIEECSIDELDNKEVQWIEHYRNTVGSYNLESGGNERKRHHKSTIKKISKISKKQWQCEVYRSKMLKKLVRKGAENHNAKAVICINTSKIYDTIQEASEDTNVPAGDIWKVCNNERVSAGFHLNGIALQFSYYEKGKEYNLKPLKNLYERKRVVLTNTGEVFENITQGAKKYNLSQGSISLCCDGKRKSAGRLPNGEYSVWVHEKDYDPKKDYTFHRHLGSHNPRARKVICLTTNKIFKTMKEAGVYYNIKSYLKISEVCRGRRKYCGRLKCGTQLRWAYYEDYQALE